MKVVSKHKLELLFLLLIIALYFVLRIPNITLQPIFADEAIYIRWAQVMRAEPTLRFISLTDGKTPLYMWILIPFFKLFTDPLQAGRMLSVASGFFTLLGLVFLGWKFVNPRAALWSALLYTITPFTLFFDRMALVDSMLAAFSIWSLNLALLVVEYQRLDLAMFLGYSLGGGWLTKTPAMFQVLSLPVTLISIKFWQKSNQKNLLKIICLLILSALMAYGIYNILRLGPSFSSLSSRNEDYVFAPSKILNNVFDPFVPHIRDLSDWFPKLFTPILLVFVLLGVIKTIFARNLTAYAILGWLLIPLLIEMFFLKTFTARYILTSIAPLLFLAGWELSEFAGKLRSINYPIKMFLLLIIVLPWPLFFDYQLLTNPIAANLPNEERRGYFEDWTAGYGLKDIAQYLIDRSNYGSVVVGTEGSFGTLPDGLQIYLDKHDHDPNAKNPISVIGGKAEISDQVRGSTPKHQTFFIANRIKSGELPPNVKLIKEYPKAVGPDIPQYSIFLFEVLPKK